MGLFFRFLFIRVGSFIFFVFPLDDLIVFDTVSTLGVLIWKLTCQMTHTC